MKKDAKEKELLILEAAIKVIKEKGFHAATTKEIAREAGIAEGTIFRYFPSKKDILHQILCTAVDKLIPEFVVGSLESIITQSKDLSVEDGLRIIFKERLNLIVENQNLIRVVLTESQFYPELMNILINKIWRPITNRIEGYLNEGIAAGVYRQFDVSILASCFFGLLLSVINNRRLLKNDTEGGFDEDVEKLVDIIFHGIRKECSE